MNSSELLNLLSKNIKSLSMGNKMKGALITTFLAMAVVFVLLIILMYLIKFMGTFFTKKPSKKVEVEEKNDALFRSYEDEGEKEENNDGEIVAAIAAAVSEMTGDYDQIVVTKIVHNTNKVPMWAAIGNIENMNNFKN